ncbi:hypothetical protein BDQ17DRAFT_846482 [Cyathus striatus]|nr:hypothetical protein BDQ17DRAFT_846482 [Cyathus striatus]
MIMHLGRSERLEASIIESYGKLVPEQALYWLELLVFLKDHPATKEIIPTLTSIAVKYKEGLQEHQRCHEQAALNIDSEDEEENTNRDVQIKPWVQALGYLAECSDLPDVIPVLVKIACENTSEDVQSIAIRVLAPLTLKDGYAPLMRDTLMKNPELLLSEREEDVHYAWISTLESLTLKGIYLFCLVATQAQITMSYS